jgi:hypothetical protein
MGVAAAFDAFGEVAGTSLVQRATPDAVRGRVFAAFSTSGQVGNTRLRHRALLDVIGPRGLS